MDNILDWRMVALVVFILLGFLYIKARSRVRAARKRAAVLLEVEAEAILWPNRKVAGLPVWFWLILVLIASCFVSIPVAVTLVGEVILGVTIVQKSMEAFHKLTGLASRGEKRVRKGRH